MYTTANFRQCQTLNFFFFFFFFLLVGFFYLLYCQLPARLHSFCLYLLCCTCILLYTVAVGSPTSHIPLCLSHDIYLLLIKKCNTNALTSTNILRKKKCLQPLTFFCFSAGAPKSQCHSIGTQGWTMSLMFSNVKIESGYLAFSFGTGKSHEL